MALPRKSSFLPTIKCSLCGNQVEISLMGEHVCGGSSAGPSSPSEEAEFISIRFSASSYNEHSRTTPPLETLSESTYVHRGQLTPVSQQSPSRHGTPVNPDSGKRLGGAQEHSRSRNVSEGAWKAPTTASPSRRPGGYGGFGDSTPTAPDEQHKGANLMDRLNHTIPGPFDSTERAPAARHAYPQRNDSLHYYTPPPPPPLKDSPAGFGVPRSFNNGHQASLSSSDAYLKPLPSTRPSHTHRAPSASGSLPDRSRNERSRSRGPASSRKPPPRTDLLAEHHSKHTACVDLAAEFGVNNPYHASNSSVSSGYSDYSAVSSSTAQTSPTRSQTHRSDLSQTFKDTRANGHETKPQDLRMDAADANSHRFAHQSVGPPQGAPPPRDFRVDRNPPGSGNGHHAPSYRVEHNSSPLRDVGGEDRRLQTQHTRTDSRSPRPQHTGERHDTRGISPLPSRGDCKACGIAITGKSISSADGRLTGKYHKACFVCSTCRAPFSSSVFYVLGDKPYCEQDYHKLNNSLCGSCKRGIEGQFAEDEAGVKYHLRCFRCLDCGVSLVDGYFEVAGYAYCERDAWRRVKAAQAGVGVGEKEARRSGGGGGPGGQQPPRGRTMPHGGGGGGGGGFTSRPMPHSGPGGKQLPPLPPPPNANSRDRGDRRLAAPPGGADQRLRMNKRMTRLGNINLNL
ncbi:hypothetical protein E4U22_006744 [Claviceps purpurea]|nr:hypothetical protein E4U22_006744 [Claviceps purpurea]